MQGKSFMLAITLYYLVDVYRSPVSPSNSLSKLCEDTLESLKQCLDANLEALREGLDERVGHVLSGKSHSAGEGDVVLQPDVLIKLTALAILPSYSLRQLGII